MTRISQNLDAHTRIASSANGAVANSDAATGGKLSIGKPYQATAAKASGSSGSTVDKLKEMIARLQEQLKEAQKRLDQASRDASANPDSEASQAALQAAQTEVASLTSSLIQAYAMLMKAVKDSGGRATGNTVSASA